MQTLKLFRDILLAVLGTLLAWSLADRLVVLFAMLNHFFTH